MKQMIARFYLMCLLNFGIYVLIVYSHDDNNMNILNETEGEEVIENSEKLNRVKRAGPWDTTHDYYRSGPISGRLLPVLGPMITVEPITNATYIITNFTSLVTTMRTSQTSALISTQTTSISTRSTTRTSTTTRIPNTTLPYNPDLCDNATLIKLSNGTCVSKSNAQIIAVEIIRNGSIDATDAAHAVSLYISSITNLAMSLNKTNMLSVDEIDNIVDKMSGANITINSNTSFVASLQPDQGDNKIVLGASFVRGIGGQVVDTTNKENITQSYLSAAAIINKESLNGVTSLNMLIIDKPTGYENIDNSTNKTLASSVIVANVKRNSSIYTSITIYLYFNPVYEYKQNGSGKYLCSFYDTNNSVWNEYGCSEPQSNGAFDRYECSCDHLTSFALIWLPESLLTSSNNSTHQFDPQDIASLIFQSISIFCFLAIIIHAIVIRMFDSSRDLQAFNLLPLISTASTTLLFIFYIALSLTTYYQTSSSNQTKCFLSASVLMFITYFCLIFMFCAKTTVGYFYYLRFVRLFPYPSHQKLFVMLFISFVISVSFVALAIGFNSQSNFYITKLYPYELCWFTSNVIYYFMTIPIGVFLLFNIITIILVTQSIIIHAQNAGSSQQINERLKRCVIVLLSSCVTQGIGWVLGPFISFISPIAGDILGWFFIIFNGLEGVWSICLYILIRSQKVDEQKRATAAIELVKPTSFPLKKYTKSTDIDERKRNEGQIIQRNVGKVRPYSFKDSRKSEKD